MAKSRIGPFALEVPLSKAKSSGQVFRGIHLEQKKLAALRVFSIPLGMTPESRQAFARQLEQLKQLRHRGIVRCYGGGFDSRKAYLAYELIDGECLKKLLERRERLPWDTTLDYAQQMAEALQYAHQMGWIHGRLKPDKVLVASDGTVKLGDWRRDEIASTIGGKPSLTQLQYSAPEVLQGDPADEKSDLYSLGVLMYTMLTGSPPFAADGNTIAELVQTVPAPNVSASVMDCPVWLSAIIEQLLHKDPRERPYSATALQLAFKEAQRRQTEGVGVLQHAAAGFSPLQMKVDRDEAEKVLGIQPKKKRRETSDVPFWERGWVLAIALVATVGAIVWFMLPLSEETLRRRAEARLPPEQENWTAWNEARDDYLTQLVARFPDGQHSEWAEEQIDWIDARERQRRLERENRTNRKSKWTDADRQYWQAFEFEEFGDLLSATDKYRAVIGLYSEDEDARPIVYLSSEAIQRIRALGKQRSPRQEFLAQKLREASTAYERARILEARNIWQWIVDLYENQQEVAPQVAEARSRLEALRDEN